MTTRWLITPWFFDDHDPALAAAAPDGVSYRLNDPGNVPDRSPESLLRTHAPIRDFVASCARDNALPVSVAGDCAASLSVAAGLQRAGLDPVLVWLDAHGDFNTPETSPSGFLGGMPLAMMVGRGDLAIPQQLGQVPLSEDRVWLIGARDLDPFEAEALKASQVHRADVTALHDLRFDAPVYLHIDNDLIDAAEVPANNYPVTGGPSLTETIAACTAFAANNRLCAISLSGWNGTRDADGKTGQACRALLSAILAAHTHL
jgi:arginase